MIYEIFLIILSMIFAHLEKIPVASLSITALPSTVIVSGLLFLMGIGFIIQERRTTNLERDTLRMIKSVNNKINKK